MADSNSFFGSIRDSETISKWCHDYGTVNNQPEIVRAGELIDILLERICHDANLIGKYSDDQVGLAKRNCDLQERINMIDHEWYQLEEKLREWKEKIEEMSNAIRLTLISSRSV